MKITDLDTKNIGFLALVGAHLYGGETEASDQEITGVYIASTREVLGLRKPQKLIRHQEGSIDLTIVELDHFAYQTAIKQNPFYIELPFAPKIVRGRNFDELQSIAAKSITQEVISNYEKFAKERRKEGLSTKKVKPLLYAFRALLTAENLALTGEIETSLRKLPLNEVISYLLERKGSTVDQERVSDIERAYQEQLERVRSAFQRGVSSSEVDYEGIEDLIYKIRSERWTNIN